MLKEQVDQDRGTVIADEARTWYGRSVPRQIELYSWPRT